MNISSVLALPGPLPMPVMVESTQDTLYIQDTFN